MDSESNELLHYWKNKETVQTVFSRCYIYPRATEELAEGHLLVTLVTYADFKERTLKELDSLKNKKFNWWLGRSFVNSDGNTNDSALPLVKFIFVLMSK